MYGRAAAFQGLRLVRLVDRYLASLPSRLAGRVQAGLENLTVPRQRTANQFSMRDHFPPLFTLPFPVFTSS